MLALVAGLAIQAQILNDLTSRTPILTFHDIIARRDASALWFDCTTSEFTGILDWLQARHAHFISVDQLYRHLTQRAPIPSHAIVLTFADNYLGFYLRAVPILRRRHIPAAMFVHTGFVGSPIGRPKMDWEQLGELERGGLIDIESQTVSHPPDLRKLKAGPLEREMSDSRRALERHLGHPVRFLAYPNGKWDERAIAAARKAGYVMAFTEDCRPAERTDSIYSVPRYVHTKYRQAWADAYGVH